MGNSNSTTVSVPIEYIYTGVAAVGIFAIGRAVINLFATPSLVAIEKRNTKPLPMMTGGGKDSTVTIWGYEGPGEYMMYHAGLSDASYYVARVEAYCRAANIPYAKCQSPSGGAENPRGKVPFANVHGAMIDDSAKIISAIETYHDEQRLDRDLSPQQLATGRLLRQTLHGDLYFVAEYILFQTFAGRKALYQEFVHGLPAMLVSYVYSLSVRTVHRNLEGHGMGKMPESDVVGHGRADWQAIGTILGQQEYILGTTSPTSYDCDLYAMLAIFFGHDYFVALPWIVELGQQYPNLPRFYQRMKDRLYPELSPKEKVA